MEDTGFTEPRLVLYSPSPKDVKGVPNRHTSHNAALDTTTKDVTKALFTSADAPAAALPTWQQKLQLHPPVPTDIIVQQNKGSGKSSSEASVVSEITQPPLGPALAVPPTTTVAATLGKNDNTFDQNNDRDIVEMKRRLEAIKERRARIKGKQPQDIPRGVVVRKKSDSQLGGLVSAKPNHQSYRKSDVKKMIEKMEHRRQHSAPGLPQPPQRAPSRQRSTVDPPTQGEENASIDSPVAPKLFIDLPDSTVDPPDNIVANEPTDSPLEVSPPPPATPPREFGSELQQFKSSVPSLSPKSAGVSTCHTFDETQEGSYEDSFLATTSSSSKQNPSWTLRRLLCKSGKMTSSSSSRRRGIDTGFGQIRATRSMDCYGSNVRHMPLDVPLRDAEDDHDDTNVTNRLPSQPPSVTRRLSFDHHHQQRSPPPPLQEELDTGDEVDDDSGVNIDADGFLIGKAALRNGRFAEYPRPPLPGKAYSEILSETSGIASDYGLHSRSLSTSCLRRDPWYMTRRMKEQRRRQQQALQEDGDDEEDAKNRTMHAVVFVNQKP